MQELLNKITLADCLEVMRTLPDKSIDLVLTDPPYGINMAQNAGLSDKYAKKDWDDKIPEKIYFDEILRVSKQQIIFGGNYFVDYLPRKSWLVWDKRCGIVPPRTFADGELAFVSYDKPMRIFRYLWDGFLQENMKNKEVRIHPTQKPVGLIEDILRAYLPNGGIVADFFSGSGTISIACHNLGLPFIAVEKDIDYYKASVERLNDARAQLKLFYGG